MNYKYSNLIFYDFELRIDYDINCLYCVLICSIFACRCVNIILLGFGYLKRNIWDD